MGLAQTVGDGCKTALVCYPMVSLEGVQAQQSQNSRPIQERRFHLP